MKWSFKGSTRRYLRTTCAVTTFVALNAVPWLSASAQTVIVNDNIDFGFVRITDNSAQHQIQINAGGGWTADPAFIFYRNPQRGEVTVTGFTPDTNLKITFTPNLGYALPQSGGGSAFEIVNLSTVPPVIKTNGIGNTTFDIVGILRTDGLGGPYSDTDFEGDITVNVEEDP